MSCLIVVFLFLAALTPRRPSSAYLDSTGAALDREWCSFYYVLASVVLTPCRRSSSLSSDNNHDKAAAAERPAKAAASTAGEFFLSFECCVFFMYMTQTLLPISQTTASHGVSIRRDSVEEVEWPAKAAASAAG